jgi:hypothetical protein
MTYLIGIVYRIEHRENPQLRYIGSTMSKLTYRWREHKLGFKAWLVGRSSARVSVYSLFDEHGLDAFFICEIKQYKVCDRAHLRAYEQLHMNRLRCINERMAFSIHRLYEIRYRAENIDRIRLRKREYYHSHAESMNARTKAYQLEHKEELDVYRKEYRTREHVREKARLKRQTPESKEYYRQRYIKHKDELTQRVICDSCQKVISKHNMPAHRKTKKCIAARSIGYAKEP